MNSNDLGKAILRQMWEKFQENPDIAVGIFSESVKEENSGVKPWRMVGIHKIYVSADDNEIGVALRILEANGLIRDCKPFNPQGYQARLNRKGISRMSQGR